MNSGSDKPESPNRERELIEAAERDAPELDAAQLAALPSPDSLPGYRIIHEIGRGGMEIVYEAEQLHPKRPVALEVVRAGARVGAAQKRPRGVFGEPSGQDWSGAAGKRVWFTAKVDVYG